MDQAATFTELYDRIPPIAREATEGLDLEQLSQAPWDGANTIAWLIWHTARIHDHHGSALMDADQLWVTEPRWSEAFSMAPDPSNTGYGHSAAEVAAVCPRDVAGLLGYLDATHDRLTALLASLSDDSLERIVDRNWDPPVTLGVRLVSIAEDGLQHMGQAAYVRGILRR